MGQNIVETIFNSKKNLYNNFPNLPDVRIFDLQSKHLLYGRIDKDGDAIYLDDSNLKEVPGGQKESHLAVDFVCAAFSDLRKNIRSAANKGFISKDSLFPTNIIAHKSWLAGDLKYSYNQYLDKLYKTFVDSYLAVDGRANKIKNFKDFVREFLRFSLRITEYFPVTKTGFLTSVHCSPFVSGLMLEIAQESHGLQTNGRITDYIKDSNFTFFVNEVKKFGFMVDKNAPWRIVFNIASGEKDRQDAGVISGGQKYMDDFAASYSNVFQTYYRKAYLDELLNLKIKLWTFYNAFYLQFSTYESIQYCVSDNIAGQGRISPSFTLSDEVIGRVKIVSKRLERQVPPALFGVELSSQKEDEYWLKILLKLRMAETKFVHNPHNFNFYANETIRLSRLFGLDSGLKYINKLTKGFHVTNFVRKGSFWYGISEEEYIQKRLKALQSARDPSTVNYSLTGTKNTK